MHVTVYPGAHATTRHLAVQSLSGVCSLELYIGSAMVHETDQANYAETFQNSV